MMHFEACARSPEAARHRELMARMGALEDVLREFSRSVDRALDVLLERSR